MMNTLKTVYWKTFEMKSRDQNLIMLYKLGTNPDIQYLIFKSENNIITGVFVTNNLNIVLNLKFTNTKFVTYTKKDSEIAKDIIKSIKKSNVYFEFVQGEEIEGIKISV